jgi:hypothetical protein
MNRIFFIIAVALTATIAIGGIVYAGGGGGMGGGGMGSGGHGMMGGGNMMDYGRGYSIPSPEKPKG